MPTTVSGVTDGWRPSTAAEALLYHALLRSDVDRFLRIVTESPLYVPAVTSPTRRLVTWTRGGREHLLAFSSPEGLASVIGDSADSVLEMSWAALERDWPDPAWWLALNPTLPIDATLPVPVGEAPSLPVVGPSVEFSYLGSEPDNELEEAMGEVLAQNNVPLLLDLLVFAEVLLPTLRPASPDALTDPYFPWAALPLSDDVPVDELAVGVFTSPARLREAAPGIDVPTVRVPLLSVVEAWPGREYALLVNPGSALRARLPGEQVPALEEWARVAAQYHGLEER